MVELGQTFILYIVKLNFSPRQVVVCDCPTHKPNFFPGMSHLVTHSISEDRYGVVQKDLAKIIVDLLTLLQVKLAA